MGYTLATFMCNYDGAGVDTACDGTGYSETTVASATRVNTVRRF